MDINEKISKERALELFDSGDINNIEIGTVKGLKDIHYYLFHDLEGYNAGEIRNVNISKGTFTFASALYLEKALEEIEKMSENSFDEIIDKYIEMNIAHPFIEGNGRTTRIWLDLILKKNLSLCVDWSKVDKDDYLNFMILSPTQSKYIKELLKESLTDKIHNRDVYMKGIDKSYEYEGLYEKNIGNKRKN